MICVAPASYAQARIWLDERNRFDLHKSAIAIYNMPCLYRLHSKHSLSIKQLFQALQLVIKKHLSFRTSLIFDTETNQLLQRIIDLNDGGIQLFTFIESTYDSDEQLTSIMHDEKHNSQLFSLNKGLVFRCHLVRNKQILSNDLLTDKDAIIFNFHHAMFDFLSMNIFLHELDHAYKTGQLPKDKINSLRYLDCKCAYLFFSIQT